MVIPVPQVAVHGVQFVQGPQIFDSEKVKKYFFEIKYNFGFEMGDLGM